MLLAIDTSTRRIGIALYDGAQVLYEAMWHSRNNHSVELSPAVAASLAQIGASVDDLEAIGVAIGPGSYTGLRIGLAVAKGLALAEDLPLIGVSTMDVQAAAQPIGDAPLAVVLEAGRGRYAVGWYEAIGDSWQAQGEAEILKPEELSQRIEAPTLICGELNADLRRLLGRKWAKAMLASPAQSTRCPAVLAELAWKRWQAGEVDDPATLAPIYLPTKNPIPT